MILIDNGHSRLTKGKCSPDKSFYEWQYNRKIARELHKRLCSEGICNVLLVPEDDYDVPLTERANRANKYGKDNLFISIHINAAGNGQWMNARGWSVFTSPGKTKSDEIATVFWEEAKKVLGPMNITLRKDMSDGDPDWEAKFTVLAKTICPAILTENCFMDNKEDLAFLQTEEGFDAIVRLHLNAIKRCIKEGLI